MTLLLDKALERNPGMLEAAVRLHQDGAIPPGTHLIDLDAVAANARVISDAAARHRLRAFAVTKQDALEPHMTRVVLNQGLPAVTAVEAMHAHRIHRYGFPLGNVGHTQQIPRTQVDRILAMGPEFVTVYSVDGARRTAEAAGRLDCPQRLYLSVANPGEEGVDDELIGGWTEDDCLSGVRPILELPNVSIAGLVQHITIDYPTQDDPEGARPTEAFFTALRVREKLERAFGLSDLRLNCAGNCNAITAGTLAGYGATDIEPGNALVGSARFHAIRDMPELPAQVFVSEITHHWNGHAYAVGGGFNFIWNMGAPEETFTGLAGRSLEEAAATRLEFAGRPSYEIHGRFSDPDGRARIGDTLLFVHIAQANMERGYVAAVSGISRGAPVLEGLCDSAATVLDAERNPLSLGDARESVERVGRLYARRPTPA